MRLPSPVLHETKARGPRHCTLTCSTATPSTRTGKSLPGNTRVRGGRRDTASASHAACKSSDRVSNQAAGWGMPDINTEIEARIPSSNKAPITQREGRHSRRQLTDALDE